MLESFVILFGFQLLGEACSHALHLPIPGPVLGMLFLFATLVWRKGVPAFLDRDVPRLLYYLPLLFVPAGVGVIQYGAALRQHAGALLLVLPLSTLLTLLLSAGLLRVLWTRQRRRHVERRRG